MIVTSRIRELLRDIIPRIEHKEVHVPALNFEPITGGAGVLADLNLSDCSSLTEVPSLEGLVCLQTLDLSRCKSLTKVPSLERLPSCLWFIRPEDLYIVLKDDVSELSYV